MSNKTRPQYADQKGAILAGFDGNSLVAEGPTVPVDGTAGYAPGTVFFKRGGGATTSRYYNAGTAASCSFKASGLGPVTAGQRYASGQATTVTASDTIVTGLTTVVSAVAVLDDSPVIGCDRALASIGDQAGTPAAGSILLKTFKPTGTGDATPIAATTFGKKVNWIAFGT